ncbi:hypothetical protein [Pyxidicoccus xibeiensis]|uniref:hypothetical protein n=1 Tax=Pyxidicoccus xibeiensis TaxID=2906759 RepID=UPI0020A76EF6|nr:hypothetical protein [Pyxidicoccus xibeiensis]MCP3140364.1 hypothetical protein [Pyxidicoccus xibeiensis]
MPVELEIVTGDEQAQALHWFDSTPVVSKVLFEVLRQAGVSNLDAYEAVLLSEDGQTRLDGDKAINVIGMVPRDTPLDPSHTGGALMFRLDRFNGEVLVHRRVKEATEAARLRWLSFQPHR